MGSIAVYQLTTAGVFEDARDAAMPVTVQQAKRKAGMQFIGDLVRNRLGNGGQGGWVRAYLRALHDTIDPSSALPSYMVCFEYYDQGVRQAPILQRIRLGGHTPASYALTAFELKTVANGNPPSLSSDGQLVLHITKDLSNQRVHQMSLTVPSSGPNTNWTYLNDLVAEIPFRNSWDPTQHNPQEVIDNQDYLIGRLSFSRCV